MTTMAFAAANLLLLALFGVYFSTLSAVSSAFRLMTEQEAKTLLAENPAPAHAAHAIRIRGGEKKQKLQVKTSALGEGREHFTRNSDEQPIFCPKCRYKVSSQTCKKRLKYLQEALAHDDGDDNGKAAALQQIFQEHPTHCRKRKIQLSPTELCFVTAEFSETADDMDQLPILEAGMINDPPRHFAFTNQPTYDVPEGWTKIVLEETISQKYTRQITKSRWPKFMGWQHPTLEHCQVIFYGDAYLLNPINETNWMEMTEEIKQNPVGLMQDKQIGLRGDDKPLQELVKVAKEGKLSYELANKTIDWLENQPDYKRDAPVYKNAIFGYDPHNAGVQQLMLDFWNIYAREELSWRDQPIWAYLLARGEMRPLALHRKNGKLFGEFGKRGHGGHVYVPEQKAEVEAEQERRKEEKRKAKERKKKKQKKKKDAVAAE